MKRHHLTLLIPQGVKQRFQHQPVLLRHIRPVGKAVSGLLQGLGTALTAQMIHGQVADNGHQPGHGLTLRPVIPGGIPHLQVGVVQHILRVMGAFDYR